MKEKQNPYAFAELTSFIQKTIDNTIASISSQEMISLFSKGFGRIRLSRILALQNLNENTLKNPRNIAKLFVGAANVELIDLEELYHEVTLSDKPIRYLSADASHELRTLLLTGESFTAFQSLTKTQVDALMFVLVPFACLADIFLKKMPVLDPKAKTAGQGEIGLAETVYINNYLRLCEDLTPLERILFYAKRLTDREPTVGMIIPHELGYYTVKQPIHGSANQGARSGAFFEGGAYAIPLKALTQNLMNLLLFRGTRINRQSTDGAKTAFDNLRAAQGSDGAMQIFHRIHKLVNLPELGFCKNPGEYFTVTGMSLGAGHAARIAVAFYDQVPRIELVSPIGLDDPTLSYYAEQPKPFIPHIIRTVEIEETIPYLGDGHLGKGCAEAKLDIYGIECKIADNAKTHESKPIEYQEGMWPLSYFHEAKGHFHAAKRLAKSLSSHHTRNAFETTNSTVYHVTEQHSELTTQLADNKQDNRATSETLRSKSIPFQHKNKYLYFLLAHAERPRYDGLDYSEMTFLNKILQVIRQSIYNYAKSHETPNRSIIENNEIEYGLELLVAFNKTKDLEQFCLSLRSNTTLKNSSSRNTWYSIRDNIAAIATWKNLLSFKHFLLLEINKAFPHFALYDPNLSAQKNFDSTKIVEMQKVVNLLVAEYKKSIESNIENIIISPATHDESKTIKYH